MSNNNFPSKGIQHLQGLLDKIQESVEDSKALTRIAHEKSRSTERYIEDASAFLGRLSPVEWGLAEAKGAGLWLRQQDSDVKSRMRDIEKQLKEMCGDDSTCGLFFPDFKFSSILDAPEQAPKKPPPVENISFRQNATTNNMQTPTTNGQVFATPPNVPASQRMNNMQDISPLTQTPTPNGQPGAPTADGGDDIGGASTSQHMSCLNALFDSTSKMEELYKTVPPDVCASHVALAVKQKTHPSEREPLTYEGLMKLNIGTLKRMAAKLAKGGFNDNEMHKANVLSIKAKFQAIPQDGKSDGTQNKEWIQYYRNEIILRAFPEKFQSETPPDSEFVWTGDSAQPKGA